MGLLIASVLALAFFWPGVDRTSDALGTADGEAGRVAREIDEKMSGGAETLWLVVEGRTIDEVRERFQKLGEELKAGSPGLNYELPFEVWPNAGHQERNLRTVAGLDAELPRLERAAEAAGFEPEALDLTRAVVGAWGRFHGQAVPVWPQTGAGKWLVDRIAARTENGWAGLGVLRLGRDEPVPAIETPGVLVAGWSRIAESLLGQVETRLRWLTGVMALALAACLRLALGSWRGVILSFGTLGFGLLLTSAMMALFGWQWNLMSLTAIPLLLGAAVDYAIHVQLALRRTQGDALEMRRTIGRALGLVTAGAVAGFGSLAFSSNAGLRSFELVCALGMICIFLVAVYLLPGWAAGKGSKS